jgi:hypothetical protein
MTPWSVKYTLFEISRANAISCVTRIDVSPPRPAGGWWAALPRRSRDRALP